MSTGLIGGIFTINQEETMEKVKHIWTMAKAHPKIAIGIAVAIVAVYFLAT
jgi:hypothetical protein